MIKRRNKCRDAIPGLPGGFTAVSFIDTHAGSCTLTVKEEATHVVTFNNRTLLRFSISILSDCESEQLCYNGGKTAWTEKLEIGSRPGSGGPRQRTTECSLSASAACVDASVKMTIRYDALGCMCNGASTVQLQVDSAAGARNA